MSALWARMTGFPYWPARYCSSREIESFANHKKSNKDTVAIMFYGLKHQKAWINRSNIANFTPETCETLLLEKKFTDDDYKMAVFEGLRVSIAAGFEFPLSFLDRMASAGYESNCLEVCNECGGTEISGQSLVCDHCDRQETHFHCIPDEVVLDILEHPTEDWYCKLCAKSAPAKKLRPTPNPNNTPTSDLTIVTEKRAYKKRTKKESSSLESIATPSMSSTKTSLAQNNKPHSGSGRTPPMTDNGPSSGADVGADICYICKGTYGQFLLCDYPHCDLVHHHGCVVKAMSTSLRDQEFIGDSGDKWFCPRHFCIHCHALQDNGHMDATNMPNSLFQSASLPRILPLSHCSNCSFAVCKQCELNISEHNRIRLFMDADAVNNKKHLINVKAKTKATDLLCFNCYRNDPLIELAKILEYSWSFLAKSRLIIPFVRPLLPLPSDVHGTPQDGEENGQISDLLAILEKIRKCSYASSAGLIDDFNVVRAKLKGKLELEYTRTHGSVTDKALETSPLLLAFNTLHESLCKLLFNRREVLQKLESEVATLPPPSSISVEERTASTGSSDELVHDSSSEEALTQDEAPRLECPYSDILATDLFDPEKQLPYILLQLLTYLKTIYDKTPNKRIPHKKEEAVVDSIWKSFQFAVNVYLKRDEKWSEKALPTITLATEAYYMNLFAMRPESRQDFIKSYEVLSTEHAQTWFDALSPVGKEYLAWGMVDRDGLSWMAPMIHFRLITPLKYVSEFMLDTASYAAHLYGDSLGPTCGATSSLMPATSGGVHCQDMRGAVSEAMRLKLRRLWRQECDYNGGQGGAGYQMTAAPLCVWEEYVSHGEMPSKARAEVLSPAEATRRGVNSILESIGSLEQEATEKDAIETMLSMRSSALRETVTLMETAMDETAPTNLADDEVELTLRRLGQVMEMAQSLQENLQLQHHAYRSSLQSYTGESITFGELPLIKELKLANECLRGRLHHMEAALVASQSLLDSMKATAEENAQLKAKNESLMKEIERLKEVTVTSREESGGGGGEQEAGSSSTKAAKKRVRMSS